MAAAEKDEMPSQVAAGLKIFPRGKKAAAGLENSRKINRIGRVYVQETTTAGGKRGKRE